MVARLSANCGRHHVIRYGIHSNLYRISDRHAPHIRTIHTFLRTNLQRRILEQTSFLSLPPQFSSPWSRTQAARILPASLAYRTYVGTPSQINHLSRMMSTTAISSEDARTALAEDGFYCIQDPTVGLCILEIERNRSQFSSSSKAGLEFCKSNILKDEVGQRSKSYRDYLLMLTAYPDHS